MQVTILLGPQGFHMPISRRTFLQGVASTLSLAPRALMSAEGARLKASFLVVSDTHLGYQDQTAAQMQWTKTVRELGQTAGEFVLHLGDVVDGGREPQYAIYKTIRDTLKKPVHEIPGNHDPLALFEKHIRKPVDTAVPYGAFKLLLLGNARIESHDGFLSAAQLAWIDEQCRAATKDSQFVILCMHVPAHTNGHPDRGWYVKPQEGQREFYELVARHQSRLLALFHGHFHNGIRGWDDHAPVHEILFPSALYNQDRRLTEQKAPGYNLDEFRPGYTQVTIEQGTLRLRYHATDKGPSVERELAQTQIT